MDKNELKERSKSFAHRCVKLALALPKDTLGDHIRRQLVRCGTSVGANYRAVCTSQSRAVFISKLAIVIEEVDESAFWMEFLIDERMLKESQALPLLKEADELKAIFVASQRTARKNKK